MNGHVRKRGNRWEVVLELGEQDAQRCPACIKRRGRNGGRLLWVEKAGRQESCPLCGGTLEDVRARRQIVADDRFATKKEASAHLITQLSADAVGDFVEPDALTLGAYLTDTWLPSLAGEELAANTRRAYSTHVRERIVPVLGKVPLQKLTTRDVTRLSTHMATTPGKRGHVLAAGTRHQALVVLHKALGAAVRDGYIRQNAAHGVKRPKVRRRQMSTWTAGELRTFLDSTKDTRLYPLWRLLAQTGMRRGEALGLLWSDVYLESGRLSVVRQRKANGYEVEEGHLKHDKPRPVPMDARTTEVLRSQAARQLAEAQEWGAAWTDCGHVFTREDGTPWHPDRVTKLFDQAVKAAPVPRIRLHDLRHTWATLALRAGVHPKIVQERLGHATIAITLDLYSHAMPDMQEDAAELVASLVDGEAAAEVAGSRSTKRVQATV